MGWATYGERMATDKRAPNVIVTILVAFIAAPVAMCGCCIGGAFLSSGSMSAAIPYVFGGIIFVGLIIGALWWNYWRPKPPSPSSPWG